MANQLYFEKSALPQALANRLVRLAAFQNPEFYKAQAMRLSIWNIPRVIGCAENHPHHIALPRGCLEGVLELLKTNAIHPVIQDERVSGQPIQVHFLGTLRPEQNKAAQAMLAHDVGVLYAATAFGKTVTAAAIIARRAVNTLVLVHRTELLKQWRERLQTFLHLREGEIGVIGGGKHKPSGVIDIAVMQCGPIRHTVGPAYNRHATMEVWPRLLDTALSDGQPEGIQALFRKLAETPERNQRIVTDVMTAYREKRHVLVLTERTGHLNALFPPLADGIENLFVLHGRLSKKQRSMALDALNALPDDAPRVLLATGRLIGEGFDHARLDTLALALPISWKGTLQQYVGRLHREHTGKSSIRIYDYVDVRHPALARMWAKRQTGYRAMGYHVVQGDRDTLLQQC